MRSWRRMVEAAAAMMSRCCAPSTRCSSFCPLRSSCKLIVCHLQCVSTQHHADHNDNSVLTSRRALQSERMLRQACHVLGPQMETFPLDGDFLLPPGAGDPAAAEDPSQHEALPAATDAAGGSDAAATLSALARQVQPPQTSAIMLLHSMAISR
jgi:hypothetical protein